jgi:hypothetical protein
MGREVTFKLRHYRKMMVHFAAPEPRLRLACAVSAVFHQLQGSRRSPNSPSHRLATGADCDLAQGHVSLVRYPLAVLARGAYRRSRFTSLTETCEASLYRDLGFYCMEIKH